MWETDLVNHLLPAIRIASLVLITTWHSLKSALELEREGGGVLPTLSEMEKPFSFHFHSINSVTRGGWEHPHELKSWTPVRSSSERARKALCQLHLSLGYFLLCLI